MQKRQERWTHTNMCPAVATAYTRVCPRMSSRKSQEQRIPQAAVGVTMQENFITSPTRATSKSNITCESFERTRPVITSLVSWPKIPWIWYRSHSNLAITRALSKDVWSHETRIYSLLRYPTFGFCKLTPCYVYNVVSTYINNSFVIYQRNLNENTA